MTTNQDREIIYIMYHTTGYQYFGYALICYYTVVVIKKVSIHHSTSPSVQWCQSIFWWTKSIIAHMIPMHQCVYPHNQNKISVIEHWNMLWYHCIEICHREIPHYLVSIGFTKVEYVRQGITNKCQGYAHITTLVDVTKTYCIESENLII